MDASDDTERRDFLYFATAGADVVASGAALWPLINQMNPSADVRALATISVDISGLAEGTQLTVNWRGKPVFIRYRTQAEMAQAGGLCIAGYRCAQSQSSRRGHSAG